MRRRDSAHVCLYPERPNWSAEDRQEIRKVVAGAALGAPALVEIPENENEPRAFESFDCRVEAAELDSMLRLWRPPEVHCIVRPNVCTRERIALASSGT